MKLLFGTTSKMKIDALKKAIAFVNEQRFSESNSFQIMPRDAESQVPSTPYENETLQGARNRLNSLKFEQADLYVGLESGLIEHDYRLFEECWCVIEDSEGIEYIGISSSIQLPGSIVKELKIGKKHDDLLDELGEQLKISSKDTWAVYSKGIISREESMFEACRNALIAYFSK